MDVCVKPASRQRGDSCCVLSQFETLLFYHRPRANAVCIEAIFVVLSKKLVMTVLSKF